MELAPYEPQRETGRPQAWRTRALPVAAVLLVSLVWRCPSLWDPPWVNDEGTYFAVAQVMAHGYKLYANVWENKPPAIYLLYSAVYHLVGPSLISVRLLATLAALGIVLAVYFLASAEAGPSEALFAAMLSGLLLGVPFLEGTTANAEVFLSCLTALGALATIHARRPVVGGALFALAFTFKSVAAFDAAATGIWLLLRRGTRDVSWLALTFLVGMVVFITAAAVAGILPAMLRDAFLYDLGYVGRANGTHFPWLLSLKAGLLLAATVALRRAPFPLLWLAYATAGALVSGRFFGHYAIQCVAPLTVSLAVLLRRRSEVASRATLALPILFLGVAGLSALAGWSLAASGHDSILARRLQWYTNFIRYTTGREDLSRYRSQIDDHVTRNERIASILRLSPAGPVLVWGNTPWVYVLSGRLPATAYTSALRDPEVPGETKALRDALLHHRPAEVVVIWPAAPPLGFADQVLGTSYLRVASVDSAAVYVLLGAKVRRESASTTASAMSGTR